MILLNTSFHVLKSLTRDFETWAKDVYIPAVKGSGIFGEPQFLRILVEVDPALASYSIQMPSPSLEEATRWHDETAALLRDDLRSRWGENIVWFSTFMELI